MKLITTPLTAHDTRLNRGDILLLTTGETKENWTKENWTKEWDVAEVMVSESKWLFNTGQGAYWSLSHLNSYKNIFVISLKEREEILMENQQRKPEGEDNRFKEII